MCGHQSLLEPRRRTLRDGLAERCLPSWRPPYPPSFMNAQRGGSTGPTTTRHANSAYRSQLKPRRAPLRLPRLCRSPQRRGARADSKRLRQAGQRPISLFVDLTNYVMLELGQPLHAYDLDKLQGPEILVRSARAGERLTTLNGAEHELQAGQMMICDARGRSGSRA